MRWKGRSWEWRQRRRTQMATDAVTLPIMVRYKEYALLKGDIQQGHMSMKECFRELSPRERKRRQQVAKKRDHMPYQLRSRQGEEEVVGSD